MTFRELNFAVVFYSLTFLIPAFSMVTSSSSMLGGIFVGLIIFYILSLYYVFYFALDKKIIIFSLVIAIFITI